MTISQSGSNASAEINGDFHDVQGDQINVTVNRVNPPEKPPQPKTSESTLETTIRVINEIAHLVNIDEASTILTDIATMLSLLKGRAKREDLNPPTRICKAICSTLALATKGFSMDRVQAIYWNAVRALRSAIDCLQSKVRKALKSRPMQRLFGSRHDVKEIDAWTAELEKISTSFSSSLNIVPVISLEQIYELRQQLNDLNSIPDPPPLPPAMFFGREGLLSDVKAKLLRDENVVLIGPGGIGKSTLAMALMNEVDVIEHCRRRFFVSYATMNQKTITFASFIECIARVLGISMSSAESERQIKTNLGLSRVLLVLDNAETFEDAVDRREATRISNFIVDIAKTPGVTVMLTSRTSSNARGVVWTQFNVPPLEKEPARRCFRKIFQAEDLTDSELDGLLAEVDFHPLSISILAYTAKENRWLGKTLLTRWNSQRGKILQMGDSNSKNSLLTTIMLSLESPSVKELGEVAEHILWIIAFFPQGINQDHLSRLFPLAHSQILTVTDILCKVSLVYPSLPYLTMLAPIRLLLLDAFKDKGAELLADARCVYYSSLRAMTRKTDAHSTLMSDHINIEYLIMADIKRPPLGLDDGAFRSAWNGFLFGLAWHNPRPTLLSDHIPSLPEGSATEKSLKAWCLHALGSLDFELTMFTTSAKYNLDARTLFVSVGNHTMASLCTFNVAVSYNNSGYFKRAQQLLGDFICSPSWQDIDQGRKDEFNHVRDMSRVQTSSEGVDNLFMPSMNYGFSDLGSRVFHWQAKMWHGYSTPEEVQTHLEHLRYECMSSTEPWDRWRFLCAMAEIAFLQRDYVMAMRRLDEAHTSVQGNFQLTMVVLTSQATVASVKGDHEQARTLLQRGLDAHSMVATAPSTDFLRILYARGRNELYAGEHATARKLLAEVVMDCDSQDDLYTKTLCMRALGEAEVLLDCTSDSERHFAAAVALCGESGAPPALFGVCTPMLKLDDDKFTGWKKYLEAHAITSKG